MLDQGIQPPKEIETKLTKDDFSDHSSISEDGLPDADLKFVVNPGISK